MTNGSVPSPAKPQTETFFGANGRLGGCFPPLIVGTRKRCLDCQTQTELVLRTIFGNRRETSMEAGEGAVIRILGRFWIASRCSVGRRPSLLPSTRSPQLACPHVCT